MAVQYDYIHEILPHDIYFLTTQQLEDLYPNQTPKEREYHITKEKGAVCLMQIGDKLASGEKHDGRAPDYDDWSLNADILVYYPVLDIALELSSMGIRVKSRLSAAWRTAISKSDFKQTTAVYDRRRHWTVTNLYVLPAESTYWRSTVLHLETRYGTNVCKAWDTIVINCNIQKKTVQEILY